jgi:hypothetical protein
MDTVAVDAESLKLMNVNNIGEHPFVTLVFKDAFEVDNLLADSTPLNVEPSYKRLPTEREFYILKVGHSLASLLHLCLQLDQALFYISNCRITPSMKNARIDRPSHLTYNIENYLIRTQMLYDRVLQLVNAVAHLCNSDENCTHKIIIENLKVKQTRLPVLLKSLKKHLGKYIYKRNQIIHVRSYNDNNLRRLALLYVTLLSDSRLKDSNPNLAVDVPEFVNYRARNIVRDKKLEYTRFNTKLFKEVVTILDELKTRYEEEKKRLAAV